MSYVHSKHFSLVEARNALARIRDRVERISHLKRELESLNYDVFSHTYFGGYGPNGGKYYPAQVDELIGIVKTLDREGILMKGLDQGLIDFPHIRENGEEVYLCWKIGEKDIEYWHRISDGFPGRRPISEI